MDHQYNLIKKNRRRVSDAQTSGEQTFGAELKELFGIAHKYAESDITLEEDQMFLIDQREPRKMKMAGVDKELAERKERESSNEGSNK